jgi:3,4-dihydroxy 2-butanone 4-phosphate synthase/GTP cyclohydrolase II
VPLESVPNPENLRYLRTKRERMGHLLPNLDHRPAPDVEGSGP